MVNPATRRYFGVTPSIVGIGGPTTIRISPRHDHVRFRDNVEYRVSMIPMEHRGYTKDFEEEAPVSYEFRDGDLYVTADFPAEQEYAFVVEPAESGANAPAHCFRVYAVADDLLNARPWKGDLHIHSNRSDGVESPAYVAAACRRVGLDFMAVTDHGQYQPSLEAIRAFADVDTDLAIFPGEEVHPPENPIHLINFGGSASVNELFRDPSYRSQVAAIENEIGETDPELDRRLYASSLWCFRKIREIGGVSIFCHPYWVYRHRYHIPLSLADRLFQEAPFDAYELIGGYHLDEVESNMLQVLRYQEERAKGNDFPVVGVSDAHGCDRDALFGWYYSIVFAPSTGLDDLAAAIRDGYAVAVEHLPGTTARVHGKMRLAMYAQFLLREVFPAHDRICRTEGEAMVDHVGGDPDAAATMNRLTGRVAAYYDMCFGHIGKDTR